MDLAGQWDLLSRFWPYGGTIGIVCVVAQYAPAWITDRWTVLPKLARYAVTVLPVIGIVFLAEGVRADASNWSGEHGFVVNAMSSAMGFCFGVPIVILVLQELSESSETNRERIRISRRTTDDWNSFRTAVAAYVSNDVCERVAIEATDVLRKFDQVSIVEQYVQGIRPLQGGGTLYSPNFARVLLKVDETIVLLRQLIEEHFKPEVWNRVYYTWATLDQVVKPKRLDLRLAWFIEDESTNLAWAIGRGNARSMFTDGIESLDLVRTYYALRRADVDRSGSAWS